MVHQELKPLLVELATLIKGPKNDRIKNLAANAALILTPMLEGEGTVSDEDWLLVPAELRATCILLILQVMVTSD